MPRFCKAGRRPCASASGWIFAATIGCLALKSSGFPTNRRKRWPRGRSSPGWEKAELEVSAWQPTSVPEWRYDSLGTKQPASCILWYRKTFKAPRTAEGKRVFLVFEGVDVGGRGVAQRKAAGQPQRLFRALSLRRDGGPCRAEYAGGSRDCRTAVRRARRPTGPCFPSRFAENQRVRRATANGRWPG